MSRSPLLLALLLAPVSARAQDVVPADRFDAHRFWMTAFDGDLRDPMRVNRPGRTAQWDWFVGAVGEYANAPLVRYDVTGPDGSLTRTHLLDHVVALNLSAGVTFHERFRLDVAAPIYFASFDANDAWQGVQFGDIRATAMIPILLPNVHDEGLGLAVLGHLDLPSGAEARFLGETTVAGGGSVALSYALTGFTLSAEAGVHFRPAYQLGNLNGTDSFVGGVGLGYKVHSTTSIQLEGLFEVGFLPVDPALTQSPFELTLSLRHRRPNGGHLLVGGAVGVTDGAGAPRARAFLGGGFGAFREPPPKDRDQDGLPDTTDACPDEPETLNRYKDQDGCPDQLGSLTIRVLRDGKPVEGAEVDLLGAEDDVERFLSTVEPRVREGLLPGTTFDAVARVGRCLAGDGMVRIAEGENQLDVPLRTVRGGRVLYEIVGPKGQGVPDATATWKTSDPGCADREGYAIGSTGSFEHPIGAGAHTVFVDAPGFRIHRQDVVVATGETAVVRVELKPTKIEVTRKEIRILESVYFEFGSAVIKPQSFALLDEIADTLLGNEVGRVLVEGHTDDRGSDAANLDLSDRRANAVREYLVGKGVPADQLLAKGFGEGRPVATNATDAGRAQNRRVVFTLLDQASQDIETEVK